MSYKPNVGAVSVALEADGTTLAPPPAANALPVAHAAHRFAAFCHLFNYLLLALGLENLTSGDRKTILKWDLIGSTSASVQQGIAARVKTGTGTKDISDVRTTLSVDGYCGSRTFYDGGEGRS